jgi:hypothetical protein
MPATLTRRKIRVNIRRKLGEPEGTEKQYSNIQLNEDIQDTLDELAAFGIIRGSMDVDGDGTAEYDIPGEILQLFLVRLGDTDYLPCFVADYIGLSSAGRNEVVQINETEDTVILPVAADETSTVTFIGALQATQTDPEDADDDDTVLNLDNRFKNLLVRGAMFRAHESDEDNVRIFEKSWAEDLARFGFSAKLARKVLYRRVTKQVNDHCQY